MPKGQKSPPSRFDLKVRTAKKVLSLLAQFSQAEVTFILDCVQDEVRSKGHRPRSDADMPQTPAHA